MVKNLPTMQEIQNVGLIPGLGRAPGGGKGNYIFLIANYINIICPDFMSKLCINSSFKNLHFKFYV